MPNESRFDKMSGIALDELSVRPASETPVQPASAQVLFNFHLQKRRHNAEPTKRQSARNLGKTTRLGMVRRAA